VGFVAHIKGQKAHGIVEQGLKILENLDHRGAVGADKLMGDGAGILIQIPDDFYRAEMAAQPGPVVARCPRPANTAWA
jgi:glutamate synthase (NADPH/NADH) large chain